MEVEYSYSQIGYNEKGEEFLSMIKENSKKIDDINIEFNIIKFINDNFTESDKYQIESIYLNQPRFNLIFGDVDHLPYKNIMAYLNYNLDNGFVMNGIKETIRSIELKRAKLVYIADDCDVKEYLDLIVRLCTENKIPFIKVLKWTNLRDLLFKGLTSRELEAIAKDKNRELKIKPRCNSAVVLFNYEDMKKMKELNSQEDKDTIMQEN
jgi:ribosomal protein L7Ae-like RNA K-turn-binding protein